MSLLNRAKGAYRRLETRYLDYRLGIDARPVIERQNIETSSPNKAHTRSATSAQYRNIKALIAEAARRGHAGGHFYDIGSGLGRVCFYAKRTGLFSAVTGVEFSKPLVDRARSALNGRESPLFIHGDAAEFWITAPSLVFMYHPFDDVVLRRFLTNNRAALERSAIAYCNDVHREVLEEHGMRCLWRDQNWKLSLWR